MTAQKIKELCSKKGITFLPHHPCSICGVEVGWYLFNSWPPYEVAFSPSCGCSSFDSAYPDTWERIAEWVCDKNGELEEEYKRILL